MNFKAGFLNLKNKKIIIKNAKQLGPIEFALDNYGKGLCMGIGPLAKISYLAGVHRLIFACRSPIWDDFFISTMGGAGIPFYATGLNYLCIEGKWKQNYCVVALKGDKGKTKFKFLELTEKKLFSLYKGYKGKRGVFALQQYIYDRFSKEYKNFRIMTVGPAALRTNYGTLMSSVVVGRKFSPVEDWAGRGGFGSQLARQGVVGIIFGGDNPSDNLPRKDVDALFKEEFGKDMTSTIIEVGEKYRYSEKLKSGGTFGSNMVYLKDWLLFFNWQSVYMSDKKRGEMYQKFITNHYLKQFNKEIIEPRSFMTCGEPCPIVCKKVYKKYKKDYEPYEANGPNCGVLDQRAAEELVEEVDILGFDAIEAGNIISWTMDMIDSGLIDLGIGKPRFDPDKFDVVKDSMYNARIGKKIANLIVYDDKGKIFRKGIRIAAKTLTKKHNNRDFIDKAVFVPNRRNGCIAPCQYWVPAFFLPLPIQGKFLSDYELMFKDPKKLGRSCIDRMIKELYSDNMGVCRFHRKWGERLLERLVKEDGKNVDFYKYHKKLAIKIAKYNYSDFPKFWESERVVDVIKTYLEKMYRGEPRNVILKKWVEKFKKDKWSAAKEYWKEVLIGINEGFGVKCFEVS